MQCSIDKSAIRRLMKEKRKTLKISEIESKSRAICTAFAATEEFCCSKTVCLYMSAFNEVDTKYIIDECKKQNKTVVVPVTVGEDIYLSLLADELDTGAFGIREPVQKNVFPKEKVDIFAVPALAFDREGGRVGFGKGYYDKLLSNTKGVKVGLCYAFQLAESIPCEKHDVLLDYVITECDIIRCRKDF